MPIPIPIPVKLLDAAAEAFPDDVPALRARITQSTAFDSDELRRQDLSVPAIDVPATAPPMHWMRYIGGNDLIGVHWLSTALNSARSVGRVTYLDRATGQTRFATGFMVSAALMMTNHHVVRADDPEGFLAIADDAGIEFDHESDTKGELKPSVRFRLDPRRFFLSSERLDFALVAVEPRSLDGGRDLAEFGSLTLNGSEGKVGTGDFANIVQHAGGDPKSIAHRENQILKTDTDALYYASDTAKGSSGAPVFDDEWQVIAIHSAGVALRDSEGRYLDKNHVPIEPVEGNIDESRVVWNSNRGIKASSIVSFLATEASGVAEHELVKSIVERAAPLIISHSTDFQIPDIDEEPDALDYTRLRLTPFRLQGLGVTLKKVHTAGSDPEIADPADPADLKSRRNRCAELKRLLSRYSGYQESFMGIRIPIPTPGPNLLNHVSRLTDDPEAFVLDYLHYSTIHHKTRKVPALTAINVDGTLRDWPHAEPGQGGEDGKEKEVTGRWVRDCRIPPEEQLSTQWYKGSGFDKGHLARKEDAEWGANRALAAEAAALTYFYTNAAPQHRGFNQRQKSDSDQWNCLEQWILERGIKKEKGKAARVSIFSGPIFQGSDPWREGVEGGLIREAHDLREKHSALQIAVSFFKVVVWYDDKGNLRTTAWELSQEKSLEAKFDPRELAFDRLMRVDQRSLRWIAQKTGLVFDRIMLNTDTYRASGSATSRGRPDAIADATYAALPGSLDAVDPCKARSSKPPPKGAPTR